MYNCLSIMYLYFICVAVLNELISTGQLLASIHGRMEKAVYIPDVYIKLQNSWVDSFLASNGYLGMQYRDLAVMYSF